MCNPGCDGRRLKTDDIERERKEAEDPASEKRRRAANRGAFRPARISGDGDGNAQEAGGNQARIAARGIRGGLAGRWSYRLDAREQAAASRCGNTGGSEWPGCRGRTAQPGSRRVAAGCRGRLGPQTWLQGHVGALERDPRARAPVLRTPRLRALQNAKIVSQTAVISKFSFPQ